MLASAYRVKVSMAAMVPVGSHERLLTLDPGSVVMPVSGVSAAGMIDLMHDGQVIRVFERDLFERSDPFELDTSTRSSRSGG